MPPWQNEPMARWGRAAEAARGEGRRMRRVGVGWTARHGGGQTLEEERGCGMGAVAGSCAHIRRWVHMSKSNMAHVMWVHMSKSNMSGQPGTGSNCHVGPSPIWHMSCVPVPVPPIAVVRALFISTYDLCV